MAWNKPVSQCKSVENNTRMQIWLALVFRSPARKNSNSLSLKTEIYYLFKQQNSEQEPYTWIRFQFLCSFSLQNIKILATISIIFHLHQVSLKNYQKYICVHEVIEFQKLLSFFFLGLANCLNHCNSVIMQSLDL